MIMDGNMIPVIFFVLLKVRNPRIDMRPKAMDLTVKERKQVSTNPWASGLRANMKAKSMAHAKRPTVTLANTFHVLFIFQFPRPPQAAPQTAHHPD